MVDAALAHVARCVRLSHGIHPHGAAWGGAGRCSYRAQAPSGGGMLRRGRFPLLTVLATLAALLVLLAPAAAADSTAPAQRVAAAWGFDDHGQLGAPTTHTCRVLYDRLPRSPVPLPVSRLRRVQAVAAGGVATVAAGAVHMLALQAARPSHIVLPVVPG